jgi:hypothetical protein
MCRSIKTLRPPFTDDVTPDDMQAAALQYVRKVSGFRTPAVHNREAFDAAAALAIRRYVDPLASGMHPMLSEASAT